MSRPIQLWFAFPDDAQSESVAAAYAALLSDDELGRLQTFRFEKSRREYLTTRALARTALANCSEISAREWRFRPTKFGKPEPDQLTSLEMNLTNCPGLVACAISEHAAVGIDAEPVHRAPQILEIAESVFTPLERQELKILDTPGRRFERALFLWTLKESYLKARGTGMSVPPQKISFVFGKSECPKLQLDPCLGDKAERWQFCSLNYAEHCITLTTERSRSRQMEIWEARPVTAPPRRLSGDEVRWFPPLEESF